MRYTPEGEIIVGCNEFHRYFDIDTHTRLLDATADTRPVELVVTISTFIGVTIASNIPPAERT